ncbi:HlyD family efflux transporter periplasmic adaptor subunit [uncultured Algibacter sp.]|uniref:HlyD family secretion protein n=1 Tax=uncultured Algibacter sp. TaxID=298659 RepID=UPI0032164E9B
MNFSSNPIHTLENLAAKNKTKSISIYLIVIIVILVFLVCLPIIHIDISSQSKGLVRAKQDNVPFITIVNGKITSCNIKNNAFIKKGDTLLTITKQSLEMQKTLNDTLLLATQNLVHDYNVLLKNNNKTLKTKALKELKNTFKAKNRALQYRTKQAEREFVRYKVLYEKEVIAKAEFETYSYNYNAAKQAQYSFIKEQRADWESQKIKLEERLSSIENVIENIALESQNYALIAPISGTLENVIGLQVGSLVNASQILGSISPNNNLIVENRVLPNDIGLLKVGQDVKFQFDAFNYNQWGMLHGKIIEIDNNITIENATAFFKVRCRLNTQQLQLKNGYKTSISKGMTLTTRYFIARRSLYDLLFDKVDDWFNPKIISPN